MLVATEIVSRLCLQLNTDLSITKLMGLVNVSAIQITVLHIGFNFTNIILCWYESRLHAL